MGNNLPAQRQDLIMAWLQEKGSLSIEELCQQLGVSVMTVHRDLDSLVNEGLVEKVHGGVMLSKPHAKNDCGMCGALIVPRANMVIHTLEGETLSACCPHCGLMMMHGKTVKSALAADFIYCRMTNVLQAYFVLESRIVLCCTPSVLCFSQYEDALNFQTGFSGKIFNYEDTQAYLGEAHHIR